jgi:hypothetical protein
MTSFFNSNAYAVSRSVLGVTLNSTANKQIEAAKDFFRFQKLYEVALNSIRVNIGQFANGDYAGLKLALPLVYDSYLTNIGARDLYYNNSIDVTSNMDKIVRDGTIFDNYISLMKNVVTGLNSGIALYNTNIELRHDLSMNALGEGIKLDEQAIQTFLNNRRTEFIPFAEEVIFRQDNLDIKIWYAKYLQQEGPPPNGVFDVDKLSTIVNELIVQGVITWDGFVLEETYTEN